MDNIQIKRSFKRKTIAIQINPDTSITVSIPYFFPASKITQFLKEKEEWIMQKKQLIKTRQAESLPGKEKGVLYLGKKYPIVVRKTQKSIVELSDKFYIATYNPQNITLYLTSWYKQQARKIIQERVKIYAQKAHLTYKSIQIASAQTRWGSCTSERDLRFNWKLIMAPLPVIDYVIAHELAHLTEMNHSKAFWETVRKLFPIYRQYNTWLKRFGHTLEIRQK
jgi:predicted metal-dependent hydrolase